MGVLISNIKYQSANCKLRMYAVNSEELSDRFLDYAASIIIFEKIRDRIICDNSGILNLSGLMSETE